MCTRVVLASTRPLPLIAWDQERRGFHVGTVAEADPVRGRVSFDHLHEIGSHTQCACGLGYWPGDGPDPEAQELSRADQSALRAYLLQALKDASLEIFICWNGEEAACHPRELILSPEEIDGIILGTSEDSFHVRIRPPETGPGTTR